MAKYTVKHSCGHEQVHELTGAHKWREREQERLAKKVCKECWKEEQKKKPLTAEVIFNDYDDKYYVAIVAGDSYSIKENLKAAGFRWMEYWMPDVIDSLPRRAWLLRIDKSNAHEVLEKVYAVGVKRVYCINSHLDGEIVSVVKEIRKQKEQNTPEEAQDEVQVGKHVSQ